MTSVRGGVSGLSSCICSPTCAASSRVGTRTRAWIPWSGRTRCRHRQGECGGLAGAGAGLPEAVPTRERRRNQLRAECPSVSWKPMRDPKRVEQRARQSKFGKAAKARAAGRCGSISTAVCPDVILLDRPSGPSHTAAESGALPVARACRDHSGDVVLRFFKSTYVLVSLMTPWAGLFRGRSLFLK